MTAPERVNITAHTNGTNGQQENGEARSSFKAALEHIDRIKTNLRDVIGDSIFAVTMLKTAEKEQKATAKEVEAIRGKLREIQSVKTEKNTSSQGNSSGSINFTHKQSNMNDNPNVLSIPSHCLQNSIWPALSKTAQQKLKPR